MDRGRVIGCPFAETASVPPLLVFSVGVSYVYTGDSLVTTSHSIAPFDLGQPLGIDANTRVRTAIFDLGKPLGIDANKSVRTAIYAGFLLMLLLSQKVGALIE